MYGCPSSEDISPYPNEVLFLYYAYIYKYSDGSYKIDVAYKYYYEYDADTDFDSGTDSGWYAKDSVGVTNGILSTTGAWLEASYTISTKQIYIIDALSKTYSTTVDCIQLYP